MHAESMEGWTHSHVFLGADHARNERRAVVQHRARMELALATRDALDQEPCLAADEDALTGASTDD